jgi:catechol 2,3-dioxygenase-like lactoylglutathione lyase family enzyme
MTVGDDPAMRPVLAFDRANTILYCHRWKETVTFYRDALRLPVAHDTDWFVEFQLTASSYLSIADASRATIAAVEGQGVTSWRVADVSAARRRLIEQGLTPTGERTLWGATVCYVRDPEGHRIELWTTQ